MSLLILTLVPVLSAEDRPVKANDSHNEYRMRVVKKGDHYVGYHNNHEYRLRGDSVSHYRVEGDYVVQGTIGSDGTYFEARELQPVQYRMQVSRRGNHYVGIYNNHEYILRGDAAVNINADGEYVAYGEIGTDGTYFETRELSPVTVQAPVVVVAERREFKMRIVRRGDRYIGIHENHEYILRGDSATRISSDGEYIVHGNIAPDGTYFETSEVRPVVIVQQQPATQEVIIIKERRDPLIKIGSLEIGR